MKNEEFIAKIKENPRWNELILKLTGPTRGVLNMEEISILNAITQLETQIANRNQVDQTIKLSEKMVILADRSTQMAEKLAVWTKWLAIATFILAAISALSILLRN
jgi:hypothetical protein